MLHCNRVKHIYFPKNSDGYSKGMLNECDDIIKDEKLGLFSDGENLLVDTNGLVEDEKYTLSKTDIGSTHGRIGFR